ncbi:MAG TPA: type I methionyl aminopeptidase [Firmicutes bacterium]|nr:type I methionyl aminopeptidase [Bacillota bacterium]
MIVLKSEHELAAMRRAGQVVAQAHQLVKENLRPGITTKMLDQIVEEFILSQNAVPAFKGYNGYPATICASVNEVVVHGIPNDLPLEEGWILSVDIGAFVDGFCGDSAWTYPIGEIDAEAQRLLTVTEESLYKGIEQAVIGNRLSDISHQIQTVVESNGFSVVRDFVGHGIGRKMHESPQIPNFGEPGRGPRLKAGMTLAIEPMVNMGSYHVRILPDNWTTVTVDGGWSAHFEHTIAITADGPEILTKL